MTYTSKEKCERRIFKICNHPTQFTEEELENVRQFLNHTYNKLADIKPDKPLCKRIHVRQDWKCLSADQRKRTILAWKRLYDNGFIQRLTDIHVRYWPAWHKTGEFEPSHRWINNQLEKAMRKIDSTLALPYWDAGVCGTQPERSSIWDTMGRNGSYENGYCVGNGIYPEWKLDTCIKRHWSPRGTVYPWFTPEFATYLIHSNSFLELTAKVLGTHFQPHLNSGGYEGQMSVSTAPYDLLFYLYHNAYLEVAAIRWHLSKKEFLTPLGFNRAKGSLDKTTCELKKSDIRGQTLTGVPEMTIRETYWLGFGEYCSIPDQLVRPINNLMKGRPDPIPTAFKRLTKPIINKYFPALKDNSSALLHMFEEIGECNEECRPIPKPTFMSETENGRRQIRGYQYDNGVDLGADVYASEQLFYNFWQDLTKAKYCSPYVTRY